MREGDANILRRLATDIHTDIFSQDNLEEPFSLIQIFLGELSGFLQERHEHLCGDSRIDACIIALEISQEDESLISIFSIVFMQVLLKSSPVKSYTFAFSARSIVMNEVRIQKRTEHIVTEDMIDRLIWTRNACDHSSLSSLPNNKSFSAIW